ncbi:hypothetical protein C8Q79DRAFT_431414 [Trametes meyenii]|nr:hypothetical protein C8Q79DRAFT_431414 [Trametes meyenii]
MRSLHSARTRTRTRAQHVDPPAISMVEHSGRPSSPLALGFLTGRPPMGHGHEPSGPGDLAQATSPRREGFPIFSFSHLERYSHRTPTATALSPVPRGS